MPKCSNEKCGKEVDPEWDTDCVVISIDGDMVCSQECYREHQKQKDHFYDNIAPDEKKFYEWFLGRQG